VQGKSLQWIVVYLGLAALSLTWTTANQLVVAAGYWAGAAADVAIVYLLLRYSPVDENTRRVMRGFIVGAGVVAVIAWLAPATDDMRLGNEDFLHPNLIGFEFAIGTLMAAYLAQQQKIWAWAATGLGVTMIRTLSKGAIVGFLFASLYYLLRGLKISRRTRVCIGLASAFILMCFWGLLEAYLDLYTERNNLETLTGRTYIWSQSLEIALERPWFGHGFDSFRWVVPPFGHFLARHAHNEMIQQFFAYGIVGISIVIGIYWSFYRQIRGSRNTGLRSLAMAVLILVLVRGLVDTDQFELCFPLWLMTLFSSSLSSFNRPKTPYLV
jgi:O-antigen ligase